MDVIWSTFLSDRHETNNRFKRRTLQQQLEKLAIVVLTALTRAWLERVGTLPASAAEDVVAPLDPTFGTNKFRYLKRAG